MQHCRRPVPTDAPITAHDVMPTGPDAPDEHVILDENVKAEGHDYYSIGAFKVNHIPLYVCFPHARAPSNFYVPCV